MELQHSVTNTPEKRAQRAKTMSLKAMESLNIKNGESSDDEKTKFYYEDSSSSEEIFDDSSESSDDSSESENEEESDESRSDTACPQPKYLAKNKNHNRTERKIKPTNAKSYVIRSEDYFQNHSEKKHKTSSHTLDNLQKPRLSQDELKKLLSTSLSDKHEEVALKLRMRNRDNFDKWICLLHEGFNVLLFGLGSKRDLIRRFHEEYLSDSPVIIVNGFFPSLTMREILESIVVEILDGKECPGNVFEASDLIANEFEILPDLHLYVIIHNIEGEMLRSSPKNQTVLAKLAAIRNVHLIASIDHVNAPLIWDHNKLSKFNFTWWDVTSFSPYVEETSFETSLMINKTGSLALSSLRNVFLSLTSNSKGIYLIVVRYQLENAGQYYQGMLFKDLYWACREAFWVSSDLALRAQLTEFVDHKMVKFRRSADGSEYLVIPISSNLLQQFLNDQ